MIKLIIIFSLFVYKIFADQAPNSIHITERDLRDGIYLKLLEKHWFHEVAASKTFRDVGPYKVKPLYVHQVCDKPRRRYMENPAVLFGISVVNATKGPQLMFNMTIVRNVKDARMKLSALIERNGKWQKYYLMDRMTCRNLIQQFVQVAFNINYDKKTCTYYKGSYISQTLDINQAAHIWRDIMEYGRVMWRFESEIAAGTMYCIEVYTLVEPVVV